MIIKAFIPELIGELLEYFVRGGYILAAWILFLALIYELFLYKQLKEKRADNA